MSSAQKSAIDRAGERLIGELKSSSGRRLLIADENMLSLADYLAAQSDVFVLSNRWDVFCKFEQAGCRALFNDFDFSGFEAHSFERVFYRVSKEKPVVHWVINNVPRLLASSGSLVFCGLKSDGTKTYFDKAKKYFAGSASLNKQGELYLAEIAVAEVDDAKRLDDRNYPALREVVEIGGQRFCSKPGLFGWDKIDKGSQLLVEAVRTQCRGLSPVRALDLGCGYGYLTLALRREKALAGAQWVATDNNAAALCAARTNLIGVDVIAADAGDTVGGVFDLIVSNPPFHQGFSMSGDLTDRFLRAVKRLLAPAGAAFLVVNQFLPLARKAEALGLQTELLEENGSFSVYKLGR